MTSILRIINKHQMLEVLREVVIFHSNFFVAFRIKRQLSVFQFVAAGSRTLQIKADSYFEILEDVVHHH